MDTATAVRLLRDACADYSFEPIAIYKAHGQHEWPLVATNDAELAEKLSAGDHFLPLPREPAALANIVEVAVVDFLLERLSDSGVTLVRGTERGYPDIELEVDGRFFAIDVKVARRAVSKKRIPTGKTDSRITLYTGNTFFLYPTLKWPGTFRPFADYEGHIDLICLYTLNVASLARVEDFEILVAEPWKIASKMRSSTTREYLGAVDDIERIRTETGEFQTATEFYAFWRNHPWKIGRAVQKQLQKLLAAGGP
ncbi:MAG TPA: type II restriction endonuclease [Allosphingosinicella sp.]